MKIGDSLKRRFFTGLRDLAVLDQERAVAREAGVEHRALIDGADVPEARARADRAACRDHLSSDLSVPNILSRRRAAAEPTAATAATTAPPPPPPTFAALPCFCAQKRS